MAQSRCKLLCKVVLETTFLAVEERRDVVDDKDLLVAVTDFEALNLKLDGLAALFVFKPVNLAHCIAT